MEITKTQKIEYEMISSLNAYLSDITHFLQTQELAKALGARHKLVAIANLATSMTLIGTFSDEVFKVIDRNYGQAREIISDDQTISAFKMLSDEEKSEALNPSGVSDTKILNSVLSAMDSYIKGSKRELNNPDLTDILKARYESDIFRCEDLMEYINNLRGTQYKK